MTKEELMKRTGLSEENAEILKRTEQMLPMMAELAVYGAVTGLMMYAFKYKTTYLSLYTSLVVALISGRVVSGILKALIFSAGNYSFSVWVTASFVTCLPGLAIQLVIIPTLVKVLAKAKLLPRRQAQKQA